MSSDPKQRFSPRVYLDHEKEEAWLNDMAGRGWDLVRPWWPLGYRFEEGEPRQYAYRVRLLPDWAKREKRAQYFELVSDSGVEVVGKAGRWGYFRRRTAEGPFEMSSDTGSLLRRASRIAWTLAISALVLLPVSLRLFDHDMTSRFEWAATTGLVLFAIAAVLGYYALQAFGKVRTLALRMRASKR